MRGQKDLTPLILSLRKECLIGLPEFAADFQDLSNLFLTACTLSKTPEVSVSEKLFALSFLLSNSSPAHRVFARPKNPALVRRKNRSFNGRASRKCVRRSWSA